MTDSPSSSQPMTTGRSLLIYGASSHGLVIAESAVAAGWRVVGFLDDHAPAQGSPSPVGEHPVHARWPVHHPSQIQPAAEAAIIIAIGDNAIRRSLQARMASAGWAMANVVHPSAWVSPSAALGQGVYIGPMAVVNALAQLGDGVIVNTAAAVEHHCQLGDFCHVCPRSAMAGHVSVGRLALLGTGASARPRVRIGNHCVIGAGAAVVCDIPDHATAMGVPARVVQHERR